jgi:hypothetical protein
MPEIKIIDSDITTKEKDLKSVKDLLLELDRVQSAHDTRVIYLKTQKKGELTLGIGQYLGFVQYMASNGDPPYLVAIDRTIKDHDFYDFDMAGTPTSIPSIYCLPFTNVKDIAVYFFVHGHLPKEVEWEKI